MPDGKHINVCLSNALFVLLDRNNQWSNIVTRGFIVFHVRTVTERKDSRLPAATIDLLSLLKGLHRSDLGVVKVDLLIDTVFKEEFGLDTRLHDKGEGRGRREKESSRNELHGDGKIL